MKPREFLTYALAFARAQELDFDICDPAPAHLEQYTLPLISGSSVIGYVRLDEQGTLVYQEEQ